MRLKLKGTAALLACLCAACVNSAFAQDLQTPTPAELAEDSLGSYNGYDTFETYGHEDGNSQEYDTREGGVLGGVLGDGLVNRPLQIFMGAEYIYARASFSQALAYVDQDVIAGGEDFVEYDFDYNSSYSFYGGVRLPDCGGAIVFDFDRYRSDASFLAQDNPSNTSVNIFGPFEVDAPQGGTLQGSASVDLKSYDLGFEKTIPLGGPLGCSDTVCGDSLSDDCCGGSRRGWCPAWDITWSAGLRFADVDWSRGATAFDANSNFVDSYSTRMRFRGAGARVGLEGRRYFGRRGTFSLFARGDWSLLVGDMDIETLVNDGINTAFLRNSARRVIPVTEIEAGGTFQVRNNIRLSGGYFISAWHDLGMREEYDFNQFQISSYDDANILAFDGFFARAEIGF